MEEQVTKAPNKKVFFAAVAVLVIVILFVLVSMASSVSRKPQNSVGSSIQNNVKKSEVSGPSPVPTDIVQIPADWKTYQNSQFSISYPPDWEAEELKFPNGDLGTSFRPLVAASANPSLLIVNITSDLVTSSQQQQSYLSQGFSKSMIQIDSEKATKLSGTFPPKSAYSAASVNIIQANHIYFKIGNSDYLLKYSYIGKGQNQDLEILFDKIISSLKFVK